MQGWSQKIVGASAGFRSWTAAAAIHNMETKIGVQNLIQNRDQTFMVAWQCEMTIKWMLDVEHKVA